jgi:SWI/SNF-related matrix-associated actin-dependent regulator 1 of chromatin subfamily A
LWPDSRLTFKKDDKSQSFFPEEVAEKFLTFLSSRASTAHLTLFVDEAHRFKEETSQRTKALYSLIAPHFHRVVLMSGTPMPNRPMELFVPLKHLAPESIDFMDRFEYGRKYCAGFKSRWGWDFSGASNMGKLAEKIKSKFLLRIKKSDVLTELPEKIREVVFLGDAPAQVEKLESPLRKMLTETMQSTLITEDAVKELLKIRDAENLHVSTYRRGLGLLMLSDMVPFIENSIEGGARPLVFISHQEVATKLAEKLREHNPIVITGATAPAKRQTLIDNFNDKASPHRVAILNIQAGGVGFDITSSTHVILAEPSWVPAENAQASDRAHRIGQ